MEIYFTVGFHQEKFQLKLKNQRLLFTDLKKEIKFGEEEFWAFSWQRVMEMISSLLGWLTNLCTKNKSLKIFPAGIIDLERQPLNEIGYLIPYFIENFGSTKTWSDNIPFISMLTESPMYLYG